MEQLLRQNRHRDLQIGRAPARHQTDGALSPPSPPSPRPIDRFCVTPSGVMVSFRCRLPRLLPLSQMSGEPGDRLAQPTAAAGQEPRLAGVQLLTHDIDARKLDGRWCGEVEGGRDVAERQHTCTGMAPPPDGWLQGFIGSEPPVPAGRAARRYWSRKFDGRSCAPQRDVKSMGAYQRFPA